MISAEVTDAIVAAACEAFGRILPSGFGLSEHDGALTLTSPGSWSIHSLADNIGYRLASMPPLDAIQDAIVSFAGNLQDDVTETVTYPWPKDARLGKSEFALPNAEIRNGTLVVWFGRESDALTPPIHIPLPTELLEL
jgi:hypothetical protein